MLKYIYHLALLIVLTYVSCIGKSPKDPILKEAFGVHKESVDIGAKAMEVWEKLPAQDSMRNVFNAELQEWGDNLAEVPGFHYHHDGLGHHHGREPLKLLPNDMLLLQKQFRDSIQSIYQRIVAYHEGLLQQ